MKWAHFLPRDFPAARLTSLRNLFCYPPRLGTLHSSCFGGPFQQEKKVQIKPHEDYLTMAHYNPMKVSNFSIFYARIGLNLSKEQVSF